MSFIILPIHPEYAEMIYSGEKRVEFRRRLPSKPVEKIYIYETAPVSKVTGEVIVSDTLERDIDDLYGRTKDLSGITKEEYYKYFKGKEKGSCFILADPARFKDGKSLAIFGLEFPPRSFEYTKNLFRDFSEDKTTAFCELHPYQCDHMNHSAYCSKFQNRISLIPVKPEEDLHHYQKCKECLDA